MIANKTLRFWSQYGRSDPTRLPVFLYRRIQERLQTAPRERSVIDIEGVRFPVDLRIPAIMKKYYFRTHEMFLERVFRRFLRPSNIFFDVGANCGYWSAFAASHVGPQGELHLFEPVERYYSNLLEFQRLNPGYQIFPVNSAVGAEPGVAEMDVVTDDPSNFHNYSVNTGSSSLLEGFHLHNDALIERREVPVITLDGYVRQNEIDPSRIRLIKIDVEGFESFVLQGMRELLHRSEKIPLLVEIVTDPERNPILDGTRPIDLLTSYGYRCLDATTMRPINRNCLGLEENIVCV